MASGGSDLSTSNEIYEKSKESFKTPGSEQKVIIDVLNEVEKTFNLSLLEALFSEDIMDTYPGLNDIYKTFKKVIPNIELFLKSDGEENEERPDIQQILEQEIDSEDSRESSDGAEPPEAL
ncbi:nuclear body protein SP140-like protein isoform X3 [Myotis lucifugus]|uniref:nuclear body protein SP140-like protein isoform X3 n=1 Tax=Myotis lucifugus TaxID=59463 RepID=UPI000CCC429C|nr:nuclear body protein SP140-like protein isoform X3 [Myotis lucifugus]